jgi:hypothetical protein
MACSMIRGYLDNKNLPAEDIVYAGRALYVFGQLPTITPNSSSLVSLRYSFGGESLSVNFSVSEESFSTEIYGTSNMGAGSDGYSSGERIVYEDGTTEGYIELYELEQQVSELYKMESEVHVEDDTALDW